MLPAAMPDPRRYASSLPAHPEPTTLSGMRIVGNQDRSEIELDPVEAYRRGRALDGMLRDALPPVARGVTRGTHAHFNRVDAARQVAAARTLNAA